MKNEEYGVKRSEIEESIKKLMKKQFPDAEEEFEIIVKPTETVDVNSPNIQNLVNAFYYVYLQAGPEICSNLYPIVRQFAKAFKEDKYLKEIENLWTGGKNQLLIPALESKVYRAMLNPFEIKRYNYGGSMVYTLGELNIRLKFVKTRLFDIFEDIYLKNDVQEPFSMPQMEPTGGVMPPL